MTMLRLDKYLTDMGVGTRSEVKVKIRKGQVTVNQCVVKKPDSKVSGLDVITVEGQTVGYVDFEYYMLNKPQGVVSATVDDSNQTVVDLVREKKRKDLFPVGRLDKDTEGLLLITNDGTLSHRLLSPKRHVEKCYFVVAAGVLSERTVTQLEEGVNIGTREQEEWTNTAKCQMLARLSHEEFYHEDNVLCDARVREIVRACAMRQECDTESFSVLKLTITEGKYHQVKRMLQAVGSQVLYLKRLSMGTLVLDDALQEGEYRHLTNDEIASLTKE